MKQALFTRALVRLSLGLVVCTALELRAQMTAVPGNPVSVVNSGVPGENSTELRARFVGELTRARPQFVVIYTGVNDAVNDRKFVSPAVFADNLQAMLRDSRAAGVIALLIAIQPVDEGKLLQRHTPATYGTVPPNRRIDNHNRELLRTTRRNGVTVVRFDRVLLAAGGAGESLSTDGVHLNATGYGLLADAVWKQLQGEWQHGATVLCIGDSLTYGQGVRPQNAGLLDSVGRAYRTYPEQLQEHILRSGG